MHCIRMHCLCVSNKFPGAQCCSQFLNHTCSQIIFAHSECKFTRSTICFFCGSWSKWLNFVTKKPKVQLIGFREIQEFFHQQQKFASCFFADLIQLHCTHFFHGTNFAFDSSIVVPRPWRIGCLEQRQLDGMLDHFARWHSSPNPFWSIFTRPPQCTRWIMHW